MAGFEVITYGRFWVIAEGRERHLAMVAFPLCSYHWGTGHCEVRIVERGLITFLADHQGQSEARQSYFRQCHVQYFDPAHTK